MLIGGVEVPDTALEAALKASGKRVVDESDYIKKAEAGNDLAKLRKVVGEGRSVEEIDAILKAHEEAEKKNKTQAELMAAELKRMQQEIEAAKGQVREKEMEIRRRDVDKYFGEAQGATGIQVIESILQDFKKPFYGMSAQDESKLTPEALNEQVTQALAKASELQKGELARLGITGNYPASNQNSSFGSGGAARESQPNQNLFTPSPSVRREADLFAIMRETSATPTGVPLLNKK